MAQKEVAVLRKALEKERCAVRSVKEEMASLRAALDSERSAVRALRRDIANQIKKVREEEAEKYTTLAEQLKNRSAHEQELALTTQKETISKSIAAEFQRAQQTRETELNRDASRKEEDLRRQLKDALSRLQELTNASNNCQTNQNSNGTANLNFATPATINTENLALRAQNKQLELRVQELLEAERHNADRVRTQYEEHLVKETEHLKRSKRESFILLEKLKCKDRTIELLEKELRKLRGRLEASNRNYPDAEKPGEPPRLGIKKRITVKTNGLSGETARTRSDQVKETNSNEKADQLSSCDNTNSTLVEDNITNDVEGPKEKNCDIVNDDKCKDISKDESSNAVGLETLYQVVVAEHQELQRAHQALAAKLRAEQKARADLETSIKENRSENPINLALAAQIQELTARQAELISENHELREQNDLLEFRILEIDSVPNSLHFKTPSSPSRSPESRGDREVDDISDSGVLSLPTSEDISEIDFHELAMEPSYRDIKSKLSHICQTIENISDRVSIQQCLSLLRHYEARFEVTLANMSPDITKSLIAPDMPCVTPDSTKSQNRIIATVLPFTELTQTNGRHKDEAPIKKLLKEVDCLQESGIFEESPEAPEYCCRWTQTDWSPDKLEATTGDLSLEIRKLKQIRERIEEQGGNKRLLRFPGDEDRCQSPDVKELVFYRDRVETLENKLAVYESSGDEQIRRLNTRLEKEILLTAQVKHLKERCNYLEDLNKHLEEEKCEFEEAENDTRLRCQKLEVKLSALGEKKSDLQVQLQQNARTVANLKSCLAEEEKKRIEARQHAQQMDALVQCYEQRNFELEEKEMEARCKVQMLEGTIPALIVYNLIKMAKSFSELSCNTCNTSLSSNATDGYQKASKLMCELQTLKKNVLREQERLKPPPSDSKNDCSFKPPASTSLPTCSDCNFEPSVPLPVPPSCSEYNNFEPSSSNAKPNESENNLCLSVCLSKKQETMCKELQCLVEQKLTLEEKIKDLELKECYYKETLAKADEIWASMESEYKEQIQECEEKLKKKQEDLQEIESLICKLNQEKERRKQLQERVCCLEFELKDLKCQLNEKCTERDNCAKEEQNRCSEIASVYDEISHMKNVIEPCLRNEIKEQKKKIQFFQSEICAIERERKQDSEGHGIEVSGLKRQISKLNKELLESECTVSELREEVQTLEIVVSELRDKFLEEQDLRERLIIKMSMEIEEKDKDIALLKQNTLTELPKNARQELEEAERLQKLKDHKNSYKKRSKSHRKHKARCQLTLKKLNEKIKSGLLLDENQFNSILSASSSDDNSSECIQITPDLLDSSLAESSEIQCSEVVNKNSLCDQVSYNEVSSSSVSDSMNNGECENPSIRLAVVNVEEDDPHVEYDSIMVEASSISSQVESAFHVEENVSELQTTLTTESRTENSSSNQRLNSAISHSTDYDSVI